MADHVVYTGFDPEFGDRLNRLISLAKAQGYAPNLISGTRSAYAWPGMKGQSQAELYSQLGKPGGPRAAAPPGYSPHQYGVAGDVAGIPQSVLERLASEVGLRAIHSDPNHLELANWQQTAATQPPRTAWDQTNPANVPSRMAMNMEANTAGGQAGPSRPGNYGQTGIQLLNAELAKRGISSSAASGAIAGLMGESGANLDPTSFNSKDPGGGSGGIGQWNRERLVGDNGMLAFARNAGVDVDVSNPLDAKKVPLAIQAQYVGHELDTTYSGVANQLKAATNPQDALNIWVKSYENPADKRAAIAQRSQYLAPVGAVIGGAGTQAPGPMDPTAQAGGPGAPLGTPGSTVNPPIPDTPGTTINSNPIASLGGKIGDLATTLKKDLGLSDDDKAQAQPDIKPDIPPAPGARNISPLLGGPGGIGQGQVSPVYAQRMAALNQPTTWGSAPPGQNPWTGYGIQTQPSVYGTSLMSQMLNDPTWMDQMAGGGSYG